jgi:hypothetical protein
MATTRHSDPAIASRQVLFGADSFLILPRSLTP